MAAREKGLDDDGVRALLAAICLKAADDYRACCRGKDTEPDGPISRDCKRFFGSSLFRYFTNGMSAEEVAQNIRTLSKDISLRSPSAKSTRPIIEEQCDEQGSLFCDQRKDDYDG